MAVIRTLLVLFLLWSPTAVAQTPCIQSVQVWSNSYSGDPIQFITYYLDQTVLQVVYLNGVQHYMYPVSINTATKFQHLGYGQSPDTLWSQLRYTFMEILQAQNHCPLLAQNGAYLLSMPQHDTPQ